MGYFDIQVNGYAGVDFNSDSLSAASLRSACEALRRDGVDSILATIITEHPDAMVARIGRIAELRNSDPAIAGMIAGIHVEGPFISPRDGFRGAHPLDAVRKADVDIAGKIFNACKGLLRVFTLAPEQDPENKVTKFFSTRGVLVSAGHTDASREQIAGAISCGLGMFTHLGNGCPMELPRHDNIIQRALSFAREIWLCFIADGVHIPHFVLRNYLELAGEKAIVTTDAMSAAGLGPGRYRLSRWDVVVGGDGAARSPDDSHLVGSAMPLRTAAGELAGKLGFDQKRIIQLTDVAPREALYHGRR